MRARRRRRFPSMNSRHAPARVISGHPDIGITAQPATTGCRPPAPGLLWTPGYWAAAGGSFHWHDGYWGRHVGFYGGVNYGHGYAGSGYEGGRWDNGHFAYNTAVNNVNTTTIHNTYVKNVTVVNVTTVTNVSYVGGSGGTVAQPSNAE